MLNSNSSAASSPVGQHAPARHFRLATRLTILILIITVPLLIGVNVYVATQAGGLIEDQANGALHDSAERTEDTLLTWQNLNGQAISELAALPGMASMDPAQQRPIVKAMASTYPDLFLIHTLDLTGADVARNDTSPLLNYQDRNWFIQAKAGAPLSYDVVISKTIGKPVLALGVPIKDGSGNVVGVAAASSKLDQMSARGGCSNRCGTCQLACAGVFPR